MIVRSMSSIAVLLASVAAKAPTSGDWFLSDANVNQWLQSHPTSGTIIGLVVLVVLGGGILMMIWTNVLLPIIGMFFIARKSLRHHHKLTIVVKHAGLGQLFNALECVWCNTAWSMDGHPLNAERLMFDGKKVPPPLTDEELVDFYLKHALHEHKITEEQFSKLVAIAQTDPKSVREMIGA